MTEIYVGRQEIFDRNLRVVGYELLYRSGEVASAGAIDGNFATSSVVVNTFLEIGLEQIVGNGLAFMNFTRNFLLEDGLFAFPKQRIVVEVLEDILPEADLIAAVRRMSEYGYTIALDDFVYRDDLLPLLELADIVKIDVMALDETQVRLHVEKLKPFGVRLLAEKVETRDQYDLCRSLGFELFQGYFLTKPRVITGQRVPANTAAILELVSTLQRPDIDVGDIEPLIRRDMALSYKLLRYINSAMYGLRTEVQSIRHAITLLGLRNVRNWATVLALSNANDKPVALMSTALCRAKMCELLAGYSARIDKDSFFMAGMFSTLDALLDLELERILEQLPVSEEIRNALLQRAGPIGSTLGTVIYYERGDWDAVAAGGMSVDTVSGGYLNALQWADATIATIGPD